MKEHERGEGNPTAEGAAPDAPAGLDARRGAPARGAERPEKRRVRDPVWDPPAILYTPKGQPPAAPARDPAAQAHETAATQRSPTLDRTAPLDEPTTRVPARADRTIVHVEELTVRREWLEEPTARREPPEEPTARREPPEEPTIRQEPPDDPTVKAEPREPRVPFPTQGDGEDEEPEGVQGTVRWLLQRHGRKLWWLHTAYALGLGACVVAFAQKGFQHARWLAITLGVAWLVLMLFFRIFGTGARQDFVTAWRGARLRFLVMTYVLKNLYQGMLFFLLPFYWKSATLDAPNRWFLLVLGGCALLATLDLVFDRVLMRWKVLASVFYGVTLFACLNLVVPALFPDTRTLWTLMTAGGVTVLAFAMLHIPIGALRHPVNAALLIAAVGGGVGLAYACRTLVPPVPMHLAHAAVGPLVLPDGRLAMEVKALRAPVIEQLRAVTDVVVPGGEGDRLRHVWRREGEEVYRAPEAASRVAGPQGAVRLQSSLTSKHLPRSLVGHWSVDVETEDGQLVGRVSFDVTD